MKIGDIVQLKSGGPKMTVNEIVRKPDIMPIDIMMKLQLDSFKEYVVCKWWDGDKFVTENFGLDSVCQSRRGHKMPIAIYKDIPRHPRFNLSLGLTLFDLKIIDIYIGRHLSQLCLLGFGIRYENRNLRVGTWW